MLYVRIISDVQNVVIPTKNVRTEAMKKTVEIWVSILSIVNDISEASVIEVYFQISL